MTNASKIKVLVIGASGMLGNAVLRVFAQSPDYEVVGSVRSLGALRTLPSGLHQHIISGIDVEILDSLTRLFTMARPDVVINCVGLVKQLTEADNPIATVPINSLLPHRLAGLCDVARARLIHISTDCVFAGAKGMYVERDSPDATDLYGRSKLLGEVDYPHAVTLRTSIIGHELASAHGLVGWFLAQQDGVRGFTRAIFSGLPTVELARVIRDNVIPRPDLRGVHHVSAAPINKYDLLVLMAQVYGRSVDITPDDKLCIDRSLDSTRFRLLTGYLPPAWPDLIHAMHLFG